MIPAAIVAGVTIAISSLGGGAPARAQSMQHFFPTRPPGAKLHTLTGTLTDFGVGNAMGGLTVRRGNTSTELYVGAMPRLDGRPIECDFPPRRDAKPSGFCPYWPSNVVIGKTIVTVRYWKQRRPDTSELVDVTTDIRSQPK